LGLSRTKSPSTRILAIGALATFWTPSPLGAQGNGPSPVVYKIEAQETESLGISLVLLGDIDGDGVKDFAASKRYDINFESSPGEVNLYSGKNGNVLRRWRGEGKLSFLGERCLAAMPDLDGDSIPELGAYAEFEGLHVYSPVTGRKWYTVNAFVDGRPNNNPGSLFVTLADLDGDGIDEFVGGSPEADLYREDLGRGRVTLFSGRTGSSLWVRWGTFGSGGLGNPIVVSGDHNSDGVPDLLCSERVPDPNDPTSFEEEGKVRVISGRTGELLRTYSAPGPYHFWFGDRMSSLGDRDGDGFPEIAISAPSYREGLVRADFLPFPSDAGKFRGWVGVFKLPEFELLFSMTGRDPVIAPFNGDHLGFTLATAGDVDGDGILDFIAGASREDFPNQFPYGRLYLCSGANGAVLETYEGRQGFDTFFERLSPLGDLDGDGRAEFLIAHPSDGYLNAARDATRAGAGSIYALKYDPNLPTFIRGDANGDGKVDITDAVSILRYAEDDFCSYVDRLPEPRPPCLAAYDIDADGCIARYDALQLLRHYFLSTRFSPVSPFPECSRFLRIEPLSIFPDIGCEEPQACGSGDDR
jgi:hypothetical protein